MSAKPWWPFFSADWRSDLGLRMCSLAARGLWIDMLALMHEGTPRGHLALSGNAITPDQLATLIGGNINEVRACLNELEAARVFDRADGGAIVSRKMVRDTEKSDRLRENGGKRWEKEALSKAACNANGDAKRMQTREPHIPYPESSSPKGEESSDQPKGAKGSHKPSVPSHLQPHVDAIWAAAPKTSKARSGREMIAKALVEATKAGHAPAVIAEAMKAYFASDDCTRDDGKFAKGAHLAIRECRWEAFVKAAEEIRDPATFTESEWTARVSLWRRGRPWSANWGPPPGSAGCLVPAKLLIAAAA